MIETIISENPVAGGRIILTIKNEIMSDLEVEEEKINEESADEATPSNGSQEEELPLVDNFL